MRTRSVVISALVGALCLGTTNLLAAEQPPPVASPQPTMNPAGKIVLPAIPAAKKIKPEVIGQANCRALLAIEDRRRARGEPVDEKRLGVDRKSIACARIP